MAIKPQDLDMKSVINQLIQLQELIEARAQCEAMVAGTRLGDLDHAIHSLSQGLPSDVATRFQRLRKRYHVAIAPIAAGACSGCGMRLPISLTHEVRGGLDLHSCPNCARLLFTLPEAFPRRTSNGRRNDEPTPLGIARFTSPLLMLPGLQAEKAEDAIRTLSMKMQTEGFFEDGAALTEAALRRETMAGTAVDHALAFPHVRNIEGGGLTLALGVHRKGFRYAPGQRKLTRLVFFMVIPTAASAFYLKLLSGLCQTFRAKEAREALLGADTPEALFQALCSTTKRSVS